MKKFKVIICIILAIYAEHVTTKRFLNAIPTLANKFNFMLSMIRKTTPKHFCGATRLGEKWAITAAHCVSPLKPTEFYVVTTDNETIYIDEIFQNDLDTFNFVNDIALLKLIIDEAPSVVTAILFTHMPESHGFYKVLVDENVKTPRLKFVMVHVATYEDCLSILSQNMTENRKKVYCSRSNKQDYCSRYGAGAPVVYRNDDNYLVAGVVSYSLECENYGVPRGYIYAEVYHNIKWINETMSK